MKIDYDIRDYLDEAGIPYAESGKNISQNWIGMSCPFCDDHSNHLGINLNSKAFSCFRCGAKGTAIKLIMMLEGKSYSTVIEKLKPFMRAERKTYGTIPKSGVTYRELGEYYESISEDLGTDGAEFLESRIFDPKFLRKQYHLRSGTITGAQKFRVVVPYFIGNRLFTFSGRDYSQKAQIPYLHCPISKSVKPPKELLYNIDSCKDTCIVVEGVFDVFRIGSGCVAVSGIQYTRNQVFVLSKFKRIFILFDPEPEAQARARQLGTDLGFCNASVEIITGIDTDPGDMKEDDVKCLRKEVFGKAY